MASITLTDEQAAALEELRRVFGGTRPVADPNEVKNKLVRAKAEFYGEHTYFVFKGRIKGDSLILTDYVHLAGKNGLPTSFAPVNGSTTSQLWLGEWEIV